MPVRISKNRVSLENIPLNLAKTTVASSTTPDIWTGGNVIDYTGTVTATGFTTAPQPGTSRTLILAAAAAFTAGANMLIDGVASGSTWTGAAGDRVEVLAITTTQFRLGQKKADGFAVAGYRSKVIYATYDLSVTGALAVTGAGFRPSRATVLAAKDNTIGWSVGVISFAGTNYGINSVHADVANSLAVTDKAVDLRIAGGGTSGYCVWASWDADGMTLTRTKAGLPTGTAGLVILFEE